MAPAPRRRATPRAGGVLVRFLVFAFVLTWGCFIPVAVAIPARTATGGALLMLGTFAPAIAALSLTALRGGREAVRDLLAPLFRWRVAAGWYAFALGFMVAIRLLAALLGRVMTGAWPRFGDARSIAAIPFAIAISTPFQAGEEIGWRGFALPRLAQRLGLATASLFLGVIWAVWHLPLFFIRDGDSYRQSFVLFSIQVVAVSVVMAFLWLRTGRSLLLPMMLHATINNSHELAIAPPPADSRVFALSATPLAWVETALLWAAAAVLLAWMIRTEPGRQGERGGVTGTGPADHSAERRRDAHRED